MLSTSLEGNSDVKGGVKGGGKRGIMKQNRGIETTDSADQTGCCCRPKKDGSHENKKCVIF